MANRNFHRVQSLVRELKILNAEVTIGSTGAPTLVSANSNGVASISRSDVGEYEITLDDKYSQLVNVHIMLQDDTLAFNRFQVIANTVSSDKKLSFATVGATATADTAPAAEELADGARLLITITVKNSSIR